jgi:uncharacterized membrane protein YgcG
MAARLPESRLLSLRSTLKESDPFIKNKLLHTSSTNVKKEDKKLISIHIGDFAPLNTLQIAWPEKISALCLHCSEKITKQPFPAVKYYDFHEDKYWVYGYFCRPCCSFAYVNEHPSTDTTRCLLWTQQVIRKFFNYTGTMKPAPPRCAMKKFGGSLDLDTFYGEDGNSTTFKAIHSHPFVTFSMYVEIMGSKHDKNSSIHETQVYGLRRPQISELEPKFSVEREQTEKPPMILNFLAKKGIALMSINDKKEKEGNERNEDTDAKNELDEDARDHEELNGNNLAANKKRKLKKSMAFGNVGGAIQNNASGKQLSNSNVSTGGESSGGGGGGGGGGNLMKYLVK